MRWNEGVLAMVGRQGRDRAPRRVVPDSTAAVSEAAREEARKGTAAADPVIGITPEGQTLPGAIVDGEFVESVDHFRATGPTGEHAGESVAAGEFPGENERSKHFWWIRRRTRSSRG